MVLGVSTFHVMCQVLDIYAQCCFTDGARTGLKPWTEILSKPAVILELASRSARWAWMRLPPRT